MTYRDVEKAAKARHLDIIGAFHPIASDAVPGDPGTLVLLGPDAAPFWPAFTASPEFNDAAPHPMDRWSTRVITDLAQQLQARPFFPFGGPPYLPFFAWALRTSRCHASPIHLLVHDHAGLFVSFRGALALPRRIALPAPPPPPCETCADKPCQTACPVSAFSDAGYDVPACKSWIGAADGADCLSSGCLARRACPVSHSYGRLAAQSGFHMKAFLAP